MPTFCRQAPQLLGLLSLGGLRNWADYGILSHATHPERQEEYFALQSADSRAILQRERHGTLFADVQRRLESTLKALWNDTALLVPYSTAFDELRQPVPYFDALGLRLPDVPGNPTLAEAGGASTPRASWGGKQAETGILGTGPRMTGIGVARVARP